MDKRAVRNSWPPVSAVGLLDLIAWPMGRRVRVRVEGSSMAPTLLEGQHAWAVPANTASVGDIVLMRHPFQPALNILKRVTRVDPDALFVEGDNPKESTDSRSWGSVPIVHLVGVVKAVG